MKSSTPHVRWRTLPDASPAVRACALAALLVCGLAACEKEQPKAPPTPEVGIVQATPSSQPLERDFVGRVVAYRTAQVRARVAGVVQQRVYREGSDVAQGDVLFRIDPAPLQAAVQVQRAALAQAQANARNAQVTVERSRVLGERQVIARQDLDDAEANARSTAALVQQARASQRQAELDLGYATVTAPIAGRAGIAQVTEGALVGQGDTTLLTTVEQVDPSYVQFNQSVADVQALQRLQAGGGLRLAQDGAVEVALSYPDGTPYPGKGTLNFSDLAVDPQTGTIALRVLVDNPDRRLLPGMFVHVRLTVGQQANVFAVPQQAIQRDGQGPYALVAGADDKIVQKRLTLGAMRGGDWIVTDGLAAGDRVVVSGIQKTRPGGMVKPTPWQRGAPGGAPAADAAPASRAGANGDDAINPPTEPAPAPPAQGPGTGDAVRPPTQSAAAPDAGRSPDAGDDR